MRIFRWLPVILLFASAVPAVRAETAAKMPAPTGYIDDYAGVFSDSAKSDMESLCREVHDKTKAQIFVVTIHSLDGASIEQFSNDLFHTWKIGEKKTDRGVLLLFAIQDHKYRYEVGYGLEGILNDAKVGDMGRAMVPDLRAGNYDAAATLGLHSVAQVIADDSKVELTGLQSSDSSAADENQQAPPPADDTPISTESNTGKFILALLPFGFGLAIFGFVAWVIVRARHGTGTSGGGGWSTGGDRSSSDSDSSSSSDSFSGGDGGDSGGGGASGSW
jgi:uncharacterized protein